MKRLAFLLALAASVATPALAKGPPWLTIELRPMGGSFLLVRTFHHGTPMALPLSGTAEGLVNGRRTSLALRFDTTAEANAFGLVKTWGEEGVWVLNLAIAESEHGGAGGVVGIDRGGATFVRFPRSVTGVSRPATRGEVEAMLRALDAGQTLPVLGRGGWGPVVLRASLPLALMALLALYTVKLATAAVRRMRAKEA